MKLSGISPVRPGIHLYNRGLEIGQNFQGEKTNRELYDQDPNCEVIYDTLDHVIR